MNPARSSRSRHLTLVSPTLSMGGAERVVSLMANHWAQSGREVTLITLDSPDADTYELDPTVRRVALGLMGESGNAAAAVWNNVRRIKALRRAIRDAEPNIVISFTDRMNVLTLLACRGLNLPVFVAERSNPARHDIGRVWSWLRRRLYPRCTALVVQSEQVREQMKGMVGDRPVHVIPNAVRPVDDELSPLNPQPSAFLIVGMGRLGPEKGFDLLIEAFARIAAKHPEWNVEILGEGPERPRLEHLIRKKKLVDRVSLMGWVHDPRRILRRAELFVLPSRYEGFPNALLEAMACGVPAVSFDCEYGPREIVRHEVDGLLVASEDVQALAEAVDRLVSDEFQRARLASRAGEVTDRFSLKSFFERWETVLSECQSRTTDG